jgi:hypothetical protein
MKLWYCDIWGLADRADAVCITTNGNTDRFGNAVMGKGIAAQAKQRFPGIEVTLGSFLRHGDNVPYPIHNGFPTLVSFPTKYNWREDASLFLIEKSAKFLGDMIINYGWRQERVVITRPGCGLGNLTWDVVEPIMERYLPNIVVCTGRKRV